MSSNQTLHTKRQSFHNQIRRKANEQTFKILRHQLPLLTQQTAQSVCMYNFNRLHALVNNEKQHQCQSEEISILLKELKEVSRSWLAQHVFRKDVNLNLLIYLQNQPTNIFLSKLDMTFIYSILLNVSASNKQIDLSSMRNLYFSNWKSNNAEIIEFLLMIYSNLLLRDSTSSTAYFLITNEAIDIFRTLTDIISNKTIIYKSIQSNFLWFSRHLIERMIIYKFQKICPQPFGQFLETLYCEMRDRILQSINENGKQEDRDKTSLNQCFIILKVLVKSQIIGIQFRLMSALESETLFRPSNIHFTDLLTAITCYSCYSLSREHLNLCLDILFKQLENPLCQVLLRVISNSIINSNEFWRSVLQKFTAEALGDNHDDIVDRKHFPKTCYFVYFINMAQTQYDIVQIISNVIYSQGEIGIFDECLEQIDASYEGAKKLEAIGFTSASLLGFD